MLSAGTGMETGLETLSILLRWIVLSGNTGDEARFNTPESVMAPGIFDMSMSSKYGNFEVVANIVESLRV